jgi:hypothetical protein
LRNLADDIATGAVVVHAVSIASRAVHEEFTVRELIVEVRVESSSAGSRTLKG